MFYCCLTGYRPSSFQYFIYGIVKASIEFDCILHADDATINAVFIFCVVTQVKHNFILYLFIYDTITIISVRILYMYFFISYHCDYLFMKLSRVCYILLIYTTSDKQIDSLARYYTLSLVGAKRR